MGELVRSVAWSQTPLGPIDAWPESLRTTVDLALASNFPISIIWGPSRIQIYNDGYWPICGGKHPRSMGQDFRTCWETAWPAIGEAFESAAAGRAAYLENQRIFLDRHGYLEETFFTFSFSPIRDESGRVAGLFHPVTETTAQILAERRLGVLREISDESSCALSVEEASKAVVQTLARHPLDVPFALLYLLDAGGTRLRLQDAAHLDPGSAAAPAALVSGDGEPWPILESLRSGAPLRVDRLEERVGRLDCGPYPEPPSSAMVLPISVAGAPHPLGVLISGASSRCTWDAAHRTFFSMLQDGVTNALVNARSHEEEKRRAEALAQIDRAKTMFFSNVSHEFRTPLTLILGPLEDALSGGEPPERASAPAAAEEPLRVAHRNALRLLRLVNTLLDFSRIEAGRVQASYEAMDLASCVEDLASNFRSACEKAGLWLRVDCPPLPERVYVDRDMWEKIVLNLLSNAFKSTLHGGIEVSLRALEERVVLRVRDTGIGIPAAELPRIFERFHRLEGSRGRTQEGTGIGLSLVQELVKLHGGGIEVESELERGTTFSISLPRGSDHLPVERIGAHREVASTETAVAAYVEEALRWLPDGDGTLFERPVAPSGPAAAARESSGHVLLADDNADMRDYVRRLLSPPYQVDVAPDGSTALEMARSRPPDLVLADVMMPGLDGFDLLRALRSEPRTRSIPVVLLSARAGEEARIEGLDAGADDYLVKPFSARELIARVASQVTMARIRREGEMRFRDMADTAPAMLWVADHENRCTFLSRGWYAFTGQAADQGLEFGWAEAVHPDDRERVMRAFVEASQRREPFRIDYRLRGADGSHRWVADAGRPLLGSDGAPIYIGSVIDVHERKQAEEALREGDRRKDEFIATLAHELRNPLATLQNGISLLGISGEERQTLTHTTEMMARQLGRLVRLVDDLMDVSRISQGRLFLRRTREDLRTILREAVEDARRPGAPDRHFTCTLPEEPVHVDGDAMRLVQVFGNLLTNAFKFTDVAGCIRVKLERSTEHAVVTIADDGIGIEAETLPGIFAMFAQAEASPVGSGSGLGIGLALAERIVTLHGGQVEARSQGLGHGSEFVVRLPLAAVQREARNVDPGGYAPEVGAELRILVVDDNLDAAASQAQLLRSRGHDVRLAHDGEEAVVVAHESRPDVVLLDIGLPRIDGHEVARRIRAQPRGDEVLIVAITGWGQEADRRKSEDSGIDVHLVKPVDFQELTQMLTKRRRDD